MYLPPTYSFNYDYSFVSRSDDVWCFEGYDSATSHLFYTFFNPTSSAWECELSYSYSHTGGNDGCFLGSDAPTKIIDAKSALTIEIEFTSVNEEDEKIRRKYVIAKLCA